MEVYPFVNIINNSNRMVVMLNEEKISLMTKLALYEQKEGKKEIPMSGYYKGDYVSLNVLNSAIIGTIAYIMIIGTIILINAEEIVNKLTELDLIGIGKQLLTYYLVFIVCYMLIAYIFYTVKFKKIRVKLNNYNADLKALYAMYKSDMPLKEEKPIKREKPVKKERVKKKEASAKQEKINVDDDLNDILELIEDDNI